MNNDRLTHLFPSGKRKPSKPSKSFYCTSSRCQHPDTHSCTSCPLFSSDITAVQLSLFGGAI